MDMDAFICSLLAVRNGNAAKHALRRRQIQCVSRRFAERANAAGARIDYRLIRGDNHAMLLRARRWHRLASRAALSYLAR